MTMIRRLLLTAFFSMAVLFAALPALDAMDLQLPAEADRAPEIYDWFPNRLVAYVWRNWNLVELDRMADVVGAKPEELTAIAQRLGLPEYNAPVWTDSQIYITVIRRNWHILPFDQMMALVNMTPQRFAFCLIEDDFLWTKLGRVKPKLERLVYTEPAPNEWRRIDEIGAIVSAERAGDTPNRAERFAFIDELKAPDAMKPDVSALGGTPMNRFPLRYVYSYFAIFGDPLLDDHAELYPDGLLEKLAAAGVNGVWLHVVLRDMAPGNDDFPEFGDGYEKRQANLLKLVERAKKFGIDVYLYMNEPRAVQKGFFEKHPGFGGVQEGQLQTICTSRPEIKKWMGDALANLFANVPGLGGIFTITGSENLTTCASHGEGAQKRCERCSKRPYADIIAEINTVMEEGVHRSAPDAKVIVWDWGWNGHGLSQNIIEKLPKNVWFMSVSEWALPIERGGVKTTVGEYSISAVGPGPRALQEWAWAKEGGRKAVAKVQLNTTWELGSVPYIPAFELVARHCRNLAQVGVDGMMMSWSLGGHPSPNLDIPQLYNRDPLPTVDEVLDTLALARYGEGGRADARSGWHKLSAAFEEFPYGGSVMYQAPIQIGPANPLRLRPTGYASTMTGIPYDDLNAWRGPYPADVFAAQLEKIADGFAEGAVDLRRARESAPEAMANEVDAEIRYADVVRLVYRSTANQTRFVADRNEWLADGTPQERKSDLAADMLRLTQSEMEQARELYRLTGEDSRIGFESSNQYFYTPNDLLEKIVNCRFVADELTKVTQRKVAKNVILFIGDGMGFNTDIAGTYFRFGENQAQRYHSFRMMASATFGITAADFDEEKETGYDSAQFWSGLDAGRVGSSDRSCVTDSAASGTALNWGHKTENQRIGSDYLGEPVRLFGDRAEAAHKSVGAVTSVQLSHATPAAVKAHQYSRKRYREIFREQVLDQPGLTVLMGTGNPNYLNGEALDDKAKRNGEFVGGLEFWNLLRANQESLGVKLIDDPAEFQTLAETTPDQEGEIPKRVIGVVRSTTSMIPVDGVPEGAPNRTDVTGLPTLSVMTLGALNILARNENGFYLMVEGGAIDYANHAENLDSAVREHTGFTRAIDTAIDWVEKYSSWDETLLIITADHETGQLWGPETYTDENKNRVFDSGEEFHGFQPMENRGKGVVPGGQYGHQHHTNALVPVWIHGAGSEWIDKFIRGKDTKAAEFYAPNGYPWNGDYIYNSDVGKIMAAAAGLQEKK